MPYLKGDNAEATKIHEDYQETNDQKAFLSAARSFLGREQQRKQGGAPLPSESHQAKSSPAPPSQAHMSLGPSVIQPPSIERTQRLGPASLFPGPQQQTSAGATLSIPGFSGSNLFAPNQDPPGFTGHNSTPSRTSEVTGLNNMQSIEDGIESLFRSEPVPGNVSSIWGASPSPAASVISPPRPNNNTQPKVSSPWGNPNQLLTPSRPAAPLPPSFAQPSQNQHPQHASRPTNASLQLAPGTPPTRPINSQSNTPKSLPSAPATPKPTNDANDAPKTTRKEAIPPKRVWCHFEEQPGRIFVNGFDGSDSSLVLSAAPRQEMTALWSLPLSYLNQKRPGAKSLQEALDGLTVGLFRRGCTENGTQASIISKKAVGENNRSYDFGVDPQSNSVRGKVPFFSPRTPGHVLFRLYWEEEPLYTLAIGPTIHVRVVESDFDSSIRFILSNFKGKKSNPTSLSSLNSLAQVMETHLTSPNDSAARAVWGCIQEARKVVEACAQEYQKTTGRLAQLEDTVEDLKKQVEEEDAKSHDASTQDDDDDHGLSEAAVTLREKTKALMSGRASCERKWRDSQLAFAMILKAAVTNPSMNMLLRRDMISKMRLELELWCPLSEEFALVDEDDRMWYDSLREVSQNVTNDDYQSYAQARTKMQMRTLGFELNTLSLDDVLYPRNLGTPNQRSMDPGSVTVFNNMSSAMGQYYQELHANEEQVVRRREMIRERTEKCVRECGVFPPGTSVVIFGSSANGFGSPESDIDMCLQLPPGSSLGDDDESGAAAMAKLAESFEQAGMKEVDTARLTARIPVIKYHCPDPLSSEDDESLIECDLSMHNPLAVLNTSLLRTYAEITPVTRVLASIIKRWAKARDINNPARHTLSSYGYLIMLLHFLTYHKRTGDGLVMPIAPPEGDEKYRSQPSQQGTPILPNLHWMDPSWPTYPRGTPYRELPSLPRNMIQHPIEEGKTVNTFFYKPSTPNDKAVLQMLFPGQDLSLAILLASFFRYYAYEFDYKRFVVSLHSTATRGLVEREVKAELDGWRNYSAALTIEDPFETFYDVAHVLRGGYYHRIRREFAVAYSKIADAASGRAGSWSKGDLRSMSGRELIEWVCEPIEREHQQ